MASKGFLLSINPEPDSDTSLTNPAFENRMTEEEFSQDFRAARGSQNPALSWAPPRLVALLTAALLLGGCASVSLTPKQPGQPGQKQEPAQSANTGDVPSIAGYWKINYTVNNKPMVASARITQAGNTFQGQGTDDHNNAPFNIAEGKMTPAGEIRFFKKYTSKKSTPIEYTGKIRMVDAMGYKGPYLEGEYVTAFNGNIIQGKWEAQTSAVADPSPPAPSQDPAQQQMPPPQQPQQQMPQDTGMQQPPAQEQPPPQQQPVDAAHAPHLSGKWNTGFIYHGKPIHSKMYIEQEGGKVWGHGFDEETKEKFSLKGWYSFPKLQFVRKYEKAKGAKTSKELTFRANVTVVNDGSYSGPYLEGETTLGERWEAQAYR
jgi:cell division septation protein DedD